MKVSSHQIVVVSAAIELSHSYLVQILAEYALFVSKVNWNGTLLRVQLRITEQLVLVMSMSGTTVH